MSLCGGEYAHIIKESIAVVTPRTSMFVLLQFVYFYSDVLLKSAQSKKNARTKTITIVSIPWVKEYEVFVSRKCL